MQAFMQRTVFLMQAFMQAFMQPASSSSSLPLPPSLAPPRMHGLSCTCMLSISQTVQQIPSHGTSSSQLCSKLSIMCMACATLQGSSRARRCESRIPHRNDDPAKSEHRRGPRTPSLPPSPLNVCCQRKQQTLNCLSIAHRHDNNRDIPKIPHIPRPAPLPSWEE